MQHLVDCCNSEIGAIKEEIDDVRWDCEIFSQQVETTRMIGAKVLKGHDQQIQILEFVLKEARTITAAIQDQSQQIIAGTTDEFVCRWTALVMSRCGSTALVQLCGAPWNSFW
jgi:hypothetical protein